MYDREAHEKAAAEARRIGWLREPLTMGRPPEGPYQVGVRCSEAVLEGLQRCCPQVSKAQFDWLADVTMGLGAGFSGMGEVCGAVSGVIMAIGVDIVSRYRETTLQRLFIIEATRKFMQRFTEEFGSVRCRDILGDILGSNLSFPLEDSHQAIDEATATKWVKRWSQIRRFCIMYPLPSEEE